ncbi:MAG: methyltransferase [Proteobacteria bacterium]|nr:methyltransferase [Pseudomonadota bacterium]
MFMDFLETQRRYAGLVHLLRPFERSWNQSVIQAWPSVAEILPGAWFEALRNLSMEQLYQLDLEFSFVERRPREEVFIQLNLPMDLRQLITDFSSFLSLPHMTFKEKSYALARKGLTEKKLHEIEAILNFVSVQRIQRNWQRGIDIGGGLGHLARNISEHAGLPMLSIDQNKTLQEDGLAISRSFATSNRNIDLSFVHSCIDDQISETIDPLFRGACLSIGLHTCGSLAIYHLDKSSASDAILNFGCCYDRITSSFHTHLSPLAVELNLPLSTYALFLATRGRQRTWRDFQKQQRVNYYRFALHLFLQEEQLATGFVRVGDAPQRAYERNCFSRPLERVLLLDRSLYLMEKGRLVSLLEFFKFSVSPRNIGIYAIWAP